MECNKDEALRAKSIAESKFEQNDLMSSKKFALKAQNLYPRLDGISQMLTTLDVFVSAEKRIGGQINWYEVLGVGSSADDDTIKKQYRKLALMLHPDKNNSVGAEGAFKLISEAWTLLSDKAKRSAYNQAMGFNSKGFQHKPPTTTTGTSSSTTHTTKPGPTAHAGSPSFCTVPRSSQATESSFSKPEKKKPMAPKSQKKKAQSAKPVAAHAVESFWTICGQCRIRYEYHIMYRNMTLLCPTCNVPFLATEIPQPIKRSRSYKPRPRPLVAQQQQQKNASENVGAPPPTNNSSGPSIFTNPA